MRAWFLRLSAGIATIALGICPAYSQSLPAAEAQAIPDSADLLERLNAAEQRIADLEAANGAATTSDTGIAAASDGTASEDASSEDHKSGETDDAASKQVDDLTKRLEDLQKEWDKHQEALKEASAEAAKKPTFEMGGRIHLDYWDFMQDSEGIEFFEHPDEDDPQYGTDPESRFEFRRVRLEFEGDVPDLMFWRMQLDFNEPREPQMKDVYLGWELPYNQSLIVGHHKRPLGLDHYNSSRFNVFAERPLAVEAFNQDTRRLGVSLNGYTDDRLFHWRQGIYESQQIQDEGGYVGDSLQLGWYGRVGSTPWYDETSGGRGYLHLGLAGAIARPDGDVTDADSNANQARFRTRPMARTDSRWLDTGAIDGAEWFEHVGVETVVNVGSVQFVGEYITAWVQRDATTPGTGPDTFFHGGYVYASYFLTGEHMPWDRETGTLDRVRPLENFFLIDKCSGGTGGGWGAWQLKARYDYLDLTDADVRGGVGNAVTFGMNWWWNPYARVQLDVSRGLIEQHRDVGGFDSGDYWLMGTRFAVDF